MGACLALLNVTTTLAVKVGQLIAELEGAGDEFGDILEQFSVTSTALSHLQSLFRSPSIPSSLVDEYEREVRVFRNRLDDIETVLNQVIENLNSKSLFKRFNQKRDLVDGGLRRLSSKLSAFNQSLHLMVTTHSSRVIALIHEGVSRVESRAPVIQDVRVDINLQYVEAARKSQKEDWENAYIAHRSWEASPTGPAPPEYEETLSIADPMDVNLETREYSSCRGPELPPKLPPQLPPRLPSRLPPKLPSRVANSQGEPPLHEPSSGTSTNEYFFGSTSQQVFTSPPKVQGETFRSASAMGGRVLGATVQETIFASAQKVQDEEWVAWQQARRNAYTTYEM